MGLMDFISGATTAGTEAAAGQQAGELQGKRVGSQLLTALLGQERERAQTDYYKSRANLNAARTPPADVYEHLRDTLLSAGNDPDDVEAAVAAARAGNRAGLNALFAPPKPVSSPILRTPGGFMRATPGQPAQPILGPDGHPVMPIISTRGANRGETSEHRDARQGLNAVNGQLKDTAGQLRAMDKSAPPLVQYPGVVTGTPADSAAARDFTSKRAAIQARADSLRGVGDRLSGRLTAGASAPGGGHAAPSDYDAEAQSYKDAVAKIRQDYANDPPTMQANLQKASDIYNRRVRALTPKRH